MLKLYKLLLLIAFSCGSLVQLLVAQNTIGLLSFDYDETSAGYNMIYPHNQSDVFLFDNCGRLVHIWKDHYDFRPGNSVYLLENGNLVKCKRPSDFTVDSIWGGGGGAYVDIRSWNNELLHQFHQNDASYRLHHDIEPLPNGNILMILWEYHSYDESIAAGRDPETMAQNKVWSEVVWEWDPVKDEIVWEWSVWDHLIQDYDPTKENFGLISQHPELININYDEHDGNPDWLHINAIDYNPVLDQIALSVPHFNEIWIVDHSTSTEEARTSSGGRSGKGGDLLYRFGNPATYKQGNLGDKRLYFQHNIQWVNPNAEFGDPDFGKLALYNNRVPPGLSPAHTINPFNRGTTDYIFTKGRFGPIEFATSYYHPDSIPIASSTGLSSVQVLPNGNILILSGRWGYAYELNAQNEIVWEYIIPFSAGIPIEQGAKLQINDNLTFRLQRYEEDYPAFAGRDLSPGQYMELNPFEAECPLDLISSTEDIPAHKRLKVFPNPSHGQFTLELEDWQDARIEVFSLTGRQLLQIPMVGPRMDMDLSHLPKGMALLRIGAQIEKILIK